MTVTWDQLQEGAKAPRQEYGPLTRTDFVRYQGASGDFNPIHLHALSAKARASSGSLCRARPGPAPLLSRRLPKLAARPILERAEAHQCRA